MGESKKEKEEGRDGFSFCDLFANERSHVGGKTNTVSNVKLNINNNGNKHIATLVAKEFEKALITALL